MAIGFLRRHQKTVLWPLAIVITIMFVFWGAPSIMRGLRDVAEVGGRRISEAELAGRRRILMEITRRSVRREDPLINMIRADAARDLGLGTSDEEIRDFLRAVVKRSIRKPEVSTEDYRKWLEDNDINPQLLQEVVAEIILQEKAERLLEASSTVTRQELYLIYCREKDMLTVRYVDFAASSFRDKIAPPTDEDVKEHFEKNKNKGRWGAPELFHAPNAKVDYIFAPFKDFQAKVEVTEEKLKAHFEATKHKYHAEDPEDGDEEGEEDGHDEDGDGHPRHKDFKDVKAEVEKDFRAKEGKSLAREAVRKAIEEAKPGDKPLADICKDHGLASGTLDSLEADDLKEHAIFGKAPRWSGKIFFAPERPEEGAWSEPSSVELGIVSHIELAYNEAKLKTLEEAKDGIVEELVRSRSAQAAAAAAAKARQDLLEESFDRALMKEIGPLPAVDGEVSPFKELAVGELINQPALAPSEDEDDLVYRVGMLTMRTSPDLAAFLADTTWRSKPSPKRLRSSFIGGGWRMTAVKDSDARFLEGGGDSGK